MALEGPGPEPSNGTQSLGLRQRAGNASEPLRAQQPLAHPGVAATLFKGCFFSTAPYLGRGSWGFGEGHFLWKEGEAVIGSNSPSLSTS